MLSADLNPAGRVILEAKKRKHEEDSPITLKTLRTESGKAIVSKTGRNMLDISNTVEVAKRYNVPPRAASAVMSAMLADLGLVSEDDKRLVVDRHKVERLFFILSSCIKPEIFLINRCSDG